MTASKMLYRDGASASTTTSTCDRGEDKPEINNCDIDSSYKEQHKRFLDRNLGYKIDSKHGIIEYEGSPRRIGQCIIEEDDKIECITSPDRRNYKLYHTSVTTPRLDSSPPAAVHLPLSARPGFPQRILATSSSPPPLIPTTVEQLHQNISATSPERKQQQQQQQNQLCSEENRILVDEVENFTSKIPGVGDNNVNATSLLPAIPNTPADDTSNDVSEIGTSSNSEQLQLPGTIDTKSSTFDYLYEFSETRKVLEEFFKCPSSDKPSILENGSDVDSIV
uniref:Uncharacterized protein n=1 Tax=Megaselia scalaris TaxID=36166 RepID=T1GS88_MEGSC